MTPAESLSRLAAAGRIRSAWLPGMLFPNGDRVLAWEGGQFTLYPARVDPYAQIPGPADPATDPATTGCLLALLREASGFPLAYVAPTRHGEGWCVTYEPLHPIDHIVHPTEHAAIVAALVSVAGRVA